MTFETVIYEPGPVARVVLNRPQRQNAQSWRLLEEMEAAFNEAVSDPDCRRNLTKPTIAMVHGYCVFGGWMIAAAMDVIFAADDALFIPVYGDYFTTTWDVGARKAKEILFGNKFMTADEAMQWGFVNRVVPAETLEDETLTYAARVAENSPYQNRTIKFAINQTLDMMGFTTSVRALHPDFNGRRPERPEREDRPERPEREERPERSEREDRPERPEREDRPERPEREERSGQQGRFRSQVGRAIDYAREDGLIPPKES